MERKINILDYIPFGKENAVTRTELARMTGLNDRAIRIAIKRCLREGEPIMSSSSAKGYWRSNDPDEWAVLIRESDVRTRTESRNTSKLRERYYAAKGIKVTKVREHTRRLGSRVMQPEQISMNIGG